MYRLCIGYVSVMYRLSYTQVAVKTAQRYDKISGYTRPFSKSDSSIQLGINTQCLFNRSNW